MTVAETSPHPPSQPIYGPNALVAQVKEVPLSGASAFNSR